MLEIKDKNQLIQLIKDGCSFSNFMGETDGDKDKPIILSTNEGNFLFKRSEIGSDEYNKIIAVQNKEAAEFLASYI